MKRRALAVLVLAAAAAPVAPAALVETNLPAPLVQYSIVMERMQRNELERARAEMQVERLQSEMKRLQSEKDALETRRDELSGQVTNLQSRAAAAAAPAYRPGARLVALVPTPLARSGAPPKTLEPLTVVAHAGPAGKGSRIRVTLAGAEYEADPADFAEGDDLVTRLERRVTFAEQQLRMVSDDPDPAETDRIARYETQIDRAKNTLTMVRAAIQAYRSAPAAAPATP
jgi:hypothetical protein